MPLGVLLIILGIVIGFLLSYTLGVIFCLIGLTLLLYPLFTRSR